MKSIKSGCPVCGNPSVNNFFNAGNQPLATNVWPENSQKAKTCRRYKQDYVQCLNCNHVWNHLFRWDDIPYSNKPNKMYNNGKTWKLHLKEIKDNLIKYLPSSPTIIEIGCGDGGFIKGLADSYKNNGYFLGFDPSNEASNQNQTIEFHQRLFNPIDDVKRYKPDLIIMRHLIEHLDSPNAFLQSLSWTTYINQFSTYLFCEVPCIDKVFETHRVADFYYEHPSHFTSTSFSTLLEKSGEIIEIKKLYGEEVITGLLKLKPKSNQLNNYKSSINISNHLLNNLKNIKAEIRELIITEEKIAIWGGTGKCAALMNHFDIKSDEFPIVVDSDIRKVGTYVPGVGQEILHSTYLVENPVQVLIIPTQWRARDIINECKSLKLCFKSILIEHKGHFIEFNSFNHPY